MPVIFFLLAVLLIPGIPGAAVAPRWALLAVVVPFIWYFISRPQITLGHVLGFIFLAWCALTLSWTFDTWEGVYQFGQFAVLGMIFCIGATQGDLRKVYIAAGLGAAVNSAAVVAQVWGWDGLPQTVRPAGLFFNKNFVAEFCAMALVGCIGLGPFTKWRWLALGAVPALWFCHSRGAEFALGMAAILLIYQYYKPAAIVSMGAVLAAGIYLWDANYSATMRVQLWQDAWDGMTFFGRGIGSFFLTYPEHATRIDPLALRPSQLHNDLLQLWFEVGPGMLAIIGLLVFALRARPIRTEHYVLVVFLVMGCVGFPLYTPATAAFAALVLGSLCRGRNEFCFPVDRSRSGVRGCHVGRPDTSRNRYPPSAGASARAVEPRDQRWRGLFLHCLLFVRPALPSYPRLRAGTENQPVRGRSVGRNGGIQAGNGR